MALLYNVIAFQSYDVNFVYIFKYLIETETLCLFSSFNQHVIIYFAPF